MHGKHTLRTWCKTQAVVALSSGEAELYGAVRASSELIGIMSAFKDFGMLGYTGGVLGDANAALAIIRRQGVGQLRHLDTNWLWIQQCAAERRLDYNNVDSSQNVVDRFTKSLDTEAIMKHMLAMGNEVCCASFEGETLTQLNGELQFIGAKPFGVDVVYCLCGVGIRDSDGRGVWTRNDIQF